MPYFSSGPQGGLVTCGRPIIKSAAPSLCNMHLQKCQKNIAAAYRKVGFNPSLTGKVTPKFSVLVAECVRQIQDKRRNHWKLQHDRNALKTEMLSEPYFDVHVCTSFIRFLFWGSSKAVITYSLLCKITTVSPGWMIWIMETCIVCMSWRLKCHWKNGSHGNSCQ